MFFMYNSLDRNVISMVHSYSLNLILRKLVSLCRFNGCMLSLEFCSRANYLVLVMANNNMEKIRKKENTMVFSFSMFYDLYEIDGWVGRYSPFTKVTVTAFFTDKLQVSSMNW